MEGIWETHKASDDGAVVGKRVAGRSRKDKEGGERERDGGRHADLY